MKKYHKVKFDDVGCADCLKVQQATNDNTRLCPRCELQQLDAELYALIGKRTRLFEMLGEQTEK